MRSSEPLAVPGAGFAVRSTLVGLIPPENHNKKPVNRMVDRLGGTSF